MVGAPLGSGDCLDVVWAVLFFLFSLHVWWLCSVCEKKDSVYRVVTVCKNSGNKSRDGEGGCNIRMIIAGAPMALHRAK